MRNTFRVIGIVHFLVTLFLIGCYVGNAIKFITCDFDSKGSWKAEAIHGVGLFGLAPITVWYDGEKDEHWFNSSKFKRISKRF